MRASGAIVLVAALVFFATETCLGLPVSSGKETKSNDSDLRYICFSESNCDWMTLTQALEYKGRRKDCTDFVDFTNHQTLAQSNSFNTNNTNPLLKSFPSAPTHQNVVTPLFAEMTANNLKETVTKLSSYHSRYYKAKTGIESMEWIKAKFEEYGIAASLFQHSDFPQPSVVARIEGELGDKELVVLGAHGDSIANRGGAEQLAPGADDDASGVANLLEVARVIAAAQKAKKISLKRTVEFVVYAAEEVGLLGSLDIAQNYKEKAADVYAVYQIEMSGYASKTSSAGVTFITDYVDKPLLSFTKTIAKEYMTLPIKEVKCGYGCSDHYAWGTVGMAAVCAAEAGPYDSALNPKMHTVDDKVGILDFDYCLEFAKLAASFALELAL